MDPVVPESLKAPKSVSGGVKRKKRFLGCSLLEHFELGQKVGVGTFGEVVKAKHIGNGKLVALKKIFTKSEQEGFPMTSLREIKLLKNVSHPSVASLIDMAVSYKQGGTDLKEVEDIFMVFPFMDHDLTGILENQNIPITVPQIKCYMKQMLEGVAYLHQKQIMHRDLKGANLLVSNRGELKITDFGLARPLEENRTRYTPGVVTRWYRPPELLFGSDIYNESVDIWGAGCIIAEMYLRRPLFGAQSDLEQLRLVCKYCGFPTEETYPGVSRLPDYSKIEPPSISVAEKRILKEFLLSKGIDGAGADLVDWMLSMDPKKRPTATEALSHEYFKCEPLPCQPGDISKFESSHVYTVQQQKEKDRETRGHDRNDKSSQHTTPNKRTRHHEPLDYDGGHARQPDSRKTIDSSLPPPPPPSSSRSPASSSVRNRHQEREILLSDHHHHHHHHERSHHNDHHHSEYQRRNYHNQREQHQHYEHRDDDRRRVSSGEGVRNAELPPPPPPPAGSSTDSIRGRRTITYDDI